MTNRMTDAQHNYYATGYKQGMSDILQIIDEQGSSPESGYVLDRIIEWCRNNGGLLADRTAPHGTDPTREHDATTCNCHTRYLLRSARLD